MQLVYEFSLLHDDIMDNDRVRRGRPTVWIVYSTDTALLAGDALLALAVSLLAEHPAAEVVLAEAMVGLCAGQADDITSQSRPMATDADWERMAAGKTAALISASCQIGAVLGGADDRTATILATAGTQLPLTINDPTFIAFADAVHVARPVAVLRGTLGQWCCSLKAATTSSPRSGCATRRQFLDKPRLGSPDRTARTWPKLLLTRNYHGHGLVRPATHE